MEADAKAGIAQREEKIAQLRTEKKALVQDLRDYANLKEKYAMLQKQHDELSEMTKRGEVLLTSQVRDLELEKEKLQAKLTNEVIERKRLHNEMEDMKGKIRVFCRIRPLSTNEKAKNSQ